MVGIYLGMESADADNPGHGIGLIDLTAVAVFCGQAIDLCPGAEQLMQIIRAGQEILEWPHCKHFAHKTAQLADKSEISCGLYLAWARSALCLDVRIGGQLE